MNRRVRRYIFFLGAILLGLALGVVYGWVINPVVYRSTGMATLRLDYKTDYALMVAELYQSEGDVAMALARLAYLEEASPLAFVTMSIAYAEQNEYAAGDIQCMWRLAGAIDEAIKAYRGDND